MSKEKWIKSDWFCPSCGKKSVWERNDEGDYYQGITSLCLGCGNQHHLDSCGRETEKGDLYADDLKKLRATVGA